MLVGSYSRGNSFIHRTQPMRKVLLLFLTCTLLFVWESWLFLGLIGLLLLSFYRIADVAIEHIYSAIKPAFWMLVLIFLVQIYLQSAELACFVVLRFITMILAASLLTLTTKTSDLISALERWFGRFLPATTAEAISLAFSLCFRFIPQVRQTLDEVTEAQRARGHSRNWRALVTPTIVRTLKSADEISEAITARSIDTHHLKNSNPDGKDSSKF